MWTALNCSIFPPVENKFVFYVKKVFFLCAFLLFCFSFQIIDIQKTENESDKEKKEETTSEEQNKEGDESKKTDEANDDKKSETDEASEKKSDTEKPKTESDKDSDKVEPDSENENGSDTDGTAKNAEDDSDKPEVCVSETKYTQLHSFWFLRAGEFQTNKLRSSSYN